ncbi:MAG: amino acid permease [Phycisphaerae bacterium]|nr:amino acid permease [Phycisphaerae bacterium]OUX03381.1 MAG: amino acid permease [Phycisphaeraceae bacterium TMED231]
MAAEESAPTAPTLKKELNLFGVFAVATGTTLSAGFFLLPGLAFQQAGPAVIVAYLVAAAMMVAPMLCKVELATAMPKAGGTYFFLDRSLGPIAGTIGGLGTWLALLLKASFALVGMGAYITLFFADAPIEGIAVALALLFGGVNFMGAKATTRFQIVMVIGLLTLLAWFMVQGTFAIDTARFSGFFDKGGASVFATAGLVFISYVGVTKVASVAEEVENPQRNLPLGIFLGLGTAVAVYLVGLIVIVGVTPAAELAKSLTPVGDAARSFAGTTGLVLVTIAALFAFMSVANAGIMSSSRYPLAMSRDHLIPGIFRSINKNGIPIVSLLLTVGAVIFCILFIDVLSIAKLASAFQLVLFALICFAVIVMRESNIESYDPSFRTPLYPWVPLAGILGPCWLITQMGTAPTLFAVGMVVLGVVWFFAYASKRIDRGGAIYHVFARLGQRRFDGLDTELRGIMKERGLRADDPFDEVVATSEIMEAGEGTDFEEMTAKAADRLAPLVGIDAARIASQFLEGTRVGATPVTRGVALPHLRLPDISRPYLVVVRSRRGISIGVGESMPSSTSYRDVRAIFFLVSPAGDPALHLRILAQLAGCVEQEGFQEAWTSARSHQALREVLLRDDRYLSLVLEPGSPAEAIAGLKIREVDFPSGSLVALVRRGSRTLVPTGGLQLESDDRLTVIGDEEAIAALKTAYLPEPPVVPPE